MAQRRCDFSREISVMGLEEVDAQLQELGWKPAAAVEPTLLEKKVALRELLEKNSRPGLQTALLDDRKSKEELSKICMELRAHLRGTKDTMVDFGKYQGYTYELVWRKDPLYCMWVTDLAIEEGDGCALPLKRLAEYIENRRQLQHQGSLGEASASSSAAPVSRQATFAALNDTMEYPVSVILREAGYERLQQLRVENPEAEIERLQQRLEELKIQRSSRRSKTAERDTDLS